MLLCAIGHLVWGHSLTLTARHNLCVGGDLVSHPSWTISFEWRLDITQCPIGPQDSRFGGRTAVLSFNLRIKLMCTTSQMDKSPSLRVIGKQGQ